VATFSQSPLRHSAISADSFRKLSSRYTKASPNSSAIGSATIRRSKQKLDYNRLIVGPFLRLVWHGIRRRCIVGRRSGRRRRGGQSSRRRPEDVLAMGIVPSPRGGIRRGKWVYAAHFGGKRNKWRGTILSVADTGGPLDVSCVFVSSGVPERASESRGWPGLSERMKAQIRAKTRNRGRGWAE
jgi:hypothetical protein